MPRLDALFLMGRAEVLLAWFGPSVSPGELSWPGRSLSLFFPGGYSQNRLPSSATSRLTSDSSLGRTSWRRDAEKDKEQKSKDLWPGPQALAPGGNSERTRTRQGIHQMSLGL